jgi:hypothetical protein
MSAKGQQEVGTAFSGFLRIPLQSLTSRVAANTDYASVAACGCVATLSNCGAAGDGSPDQFARSVLAAGQDPPAMGQQRLFDFYYPFAVIVLTDLVPTQSATYWVYAGSALEWYPYTATMLAGASLNQSIEFAFSMSLSGAYRRAEVTQVIPADQASLRHPSQRTLTGGWWGDNSTTKTVTCGSVSASGNYGFTTGETELDPSRIDLGFGYNDAPSIHTAYAETEISAGAGDVQINLSAWTFYIDSHTLGSGGHDGSVWHWHGASGDPAYTVPDIDANTHWKMVPSGNVISVQRCAGIASGAIAWSEAGMVMAKRIVPRLWKQNKD